MTGRLLSPADYARQALDLLDRADTAVLERRIGLYAAAAAYAAVAAIPADVLAEAQTEARS